MSYPPRLSTQERWIKHAELTSAEWLHNTKSDTAVWMKVQNPDKLGVGSFGNQVIIVQKMDIAAPGARPAFVSDNRWVATRWDPPADIADTRVTNLVDDRLSRSFGAVVEHNDFDADAVLAERAQHGLVKWRGTSKCRNNYGNVGCTYV